MIPLIMVILLSLPCPEQDINRSVRIRHETGKSNGSGTLISQSGNQGLILTVKHFQFVPDSEIKVQFPNGYICDGKFLVADEIADLAAILIPLPPDMFSNQIGIDELRTDEFYWRVGYRGGIGPYTTRTTVSKMNLPIVQNGIATEIMSHNFHQGCKEGDSGSGIFNQRGNLVGVMWGGESNYSVATGKQEICNFLNRKCGPKWRIR